MKPPPTIPIRLTASRWTDLGAAHRRRLSPPRRRRSGRRNRPRIDRALAYSAASGIEFVRVGSMRDWEENQVRRVGSVLIVAIVALAATIVPAAATAAGKGKKDTARYILPPGNYGGLPFTSNSTDQLPLYSGLTPLRDNVTKADINDLFLPEDFAPIGDAHEEDTGRARPAADLRRLRDPARLRQDPRRRRLRRRLGDRPRPPAAAHARPRPGPRRGRRRPQPRRLLAWSPAARPSSPAPRPRRWSPSSASCSSRSTARRASRSSATPQPTPTASTPTWRRTASTSRRRPSTT